MTGLVEAVCQLRHEAGPRQVRRARRGLVSGYGMVGYGHGLSASSVVVERPRCERDTRLPATHRGYRQQNVSRGLGRGKPAHPALPRMHPQHLLPTAGLSPLLVE